jgi:signal transduction histidine kinase
MKAKTSRSATIRPTGRSRWRPSLFQILMLALATMLLPLLTIAATGVLTFRTSIRGLEEFRAETVDETKRIEATRSLLVDADDLGEAYAEQESAASSKRYSALHGRLDRLFGELGSLNTKPERKLALDARSLWLQAHRDLGNTISRPPGITVDEGLDPFHDHIDEAASVLADLHSLNTGQVATEISALREQEQVQLLAALATLLVGLITAALLVRGLHRRIATPLLSLEDAATRFGADDFTHRIAVKGDDELAKVACAFNTMATKLEASRAEQARMELELRLAQKLESIGHLAAGIAHEINTPVQYIGDSVRFAHDAFDDLMTLNSEYRAIAEALPKPLRERLAEVELDADLDYITEHAPAAFERAFDGIERVSRIVGAMKDFAHPPATNKAPADLNAALESTLVVASNEIRFAADVETEFGELPPVECHLSDLNQAFLNLIVNAAHAIQEGVSEGGRGMIFVRTRRDGDDAVVEIRDTGCGIPEDICQRVFDPFFTTKAVGRGSGQGLALARTIMVDGHGGTLTFESEAGIGTTFTMRIPIEAATPRERLAA